MPIEVELPDGSIAEFPDGTDNATMERALASYSQAPARESSSTSRGQPDFSNVSGGVQSSERGRGERKPRLYTSEAYDAGAASRGGVRDFVAGVGQSLDTAGRGVRQGLVEGTAGVNALQAKLAGAMGMDGARDNLLAAGAPLREYSGRLREQNTQRRADNAELGRSFPAAAGNALGTIGQFVGPGILARGTAAGAALLPTTVRGNALQGALVGGLQPYTSREEQAANTGLGAVAGAAGAAAPALAGRLSRAGVVTNPVKREAAKVAEANNIPLHASQLADSVSGKTMASMGKYLPFSGAGAAAGRQQEAFNRALGRTFGADVPQLTDDAVEAARRRISQDFENVYGRNSVPINAQNATRLAKVENDAAKRLTMDEAQVLRNQMDDILQEAQATGDITGQKYQALRTQIMKAESPDRLGQAVKALRQELDDIAADSVGPQDAALLKKARGEWANYRTAKDLLKQVSGAGGDIKPSAIWPAIRKGSTREMRDLGRLGQVLLKDTIPDSGTAGRLLSLNLLGAGGLAGGTSGLAASGALVGTGATLGRIANSPQLAKLMLRNPKLRKEVEKNLISAGGLTGRYALPQSE